MSYEPTQWSAGDTVTSAKLNKMEQGIANNNVIIETCNYYNDKEGSYGEDYFKSTHTLAEIINWCKAGKQVIFCFPNQDSWIWTTTEYWPIIGYTDNMVYISSANNTISAYTQSDYISGMYVDSEDAEIIFTIYVAD